MSGFSGEGFDTFPNLHEDNKSIGNASSWNPEHLDNKYEEYLNFMERPDLMPRAREVGQRILNHLEFERAQRIEDLINGTR